MRILSARISRARRLGRDSGLVEAVVTLLAIGQDDAVPRQAHLRVCAPVRAPGAAPLRARLLASAKLMAATRPALWQTGTAQTHRASAA